MKLNNKGVTALQGVFVAVIIIVILAAVAYLLGSSPATASNPVTIFINGVEQTGNYTTPQILTWDNAIDGWQYDKNFTVQNNAAQNLKVTLLTTEPAESHVTWALNNSNLTPSSTISSPLTVSNYKSGVYTWKLQTINGTAPTPTPTISPSPTPSPTPTPNALQFTISCDTGIKNVTVTRNSQTSFVILPENMPKTYTYTAGDTLKFEVAMQSDFTFNGWDFKDGSMPEMANPLIITKATLHATMGNFTLTATSIIG